MMRRRMMEMMIRAARLVLVLFLVSPANLSGQISDFQTWTKLDLRKDFGRNAEGSLELGQRLKENSLRYDRTLITASAEYDLSDRTEVAAGGRFYLVSNSEMEIVSRYRIHGDFSYKLESGSLELGYRHRLQYGFDDIETISAYTKNKLKSRSRLGAAYHIFGTRYTLESNYEIFLGIFMTDGIYPVNHRFKLGTAITLTPRADMEVAYLLEKEVSVVEPVTAHILVAVLKYQL